MRKFNTTWDGGAILIEIAISLPIFLVFLFFIFWIGLYVQAQSAFQTAVSMGLRLGVTRATAVPIIGWGDPSTQTANGFGEILYADFLKGATPCLTGGSLGDPPSFNVTGCDPALFATPVDLAPRWQNKDFIAENYYDVADYIPPGYGTIPVFNRGLLELPASYAYSVIYINQALRQSMGPGIRFPCDPNGPPEKGDGAGCVICQFLNPYSPQEDASVSPTLWNEALSGQPPSRSLAIECRFKPNNGALGMLEKMMSGITGQRIEMQTTLVERAAIDLADPFREF